MARYAWCTDIHLDHLSDQGVINFAKQMVVSNPDGIIVTGDISIAPKLVLHLSLFESVVQRPVYFVLGNHDYYNGSIEEVRKSMKDVTNMSQYLRYLPQSPYAVLSQTTALVGHDGWYDAGNGNWKTSTFGMSDWSLIKEIAIPSYGGRDKSAIVETVQKLAHEGVMHVHNGIKSAVRYHKNVIVATHVPPYPNTHIYKGQVGDANAQPWFTSKMMGDMLLDASVAFPKVMFTVLAGHTHGPFSGKIRDNLYVHVGEAEYGSPKLQQVIDVP